MDRAVAMEYIDFNPAGDAINAALAKQRRVKNHHPALPYRDLPAALQAVRDSTASLPVKLAFEMLALTACRSGEIRGMVWGEVNLGEATWTIPGTRMKAGKLHRVPLSCRAQAILEEARGLSDGGHLVFPAPELAVWFQTWPSRRCSGDSSWDSFPTASDPASGTGRRSRPTRAMT